MYTDMRKYLLSLTNNDQMKQQESCGGYKTKDLPCKRLAEKKEPAELCLPAILYSLCIAQFLQECKKRSANLIVL